MASIESPLDGALLRRDLVVVGASAGGVEVLKRVVADLPSGLPAAICIVLHLAPGSPSALAGILRRAGPLPCRPAVDGDELVPGEILVAPPDHHLIVEDGHVRLTVGPRENNHRPAVDTLFRSAAVERGERVVGVVLSGTRDDGTAGLGLIKAHGGAAIVQDPREAMYPGMPASALAHVNSDAVVPSGQIAAVIEAVVNGAELPPGTDPQNGHNDPPEPDPATVACPECGGVLSERAEAGTSYWECRVGHRYAPESLVDAQADEVEAALWTAVRALDDRGRLLDRMAGRAEARGAVRTARSFRRRAQLAAHQADQVRGALTQAAQSSLQRLVDDAEPAAEAEDDVA